MHRRFEAWAWNQHGISSITSHCTGHKARPDSRGGDWTLHSGTQGGVKNWGHFCHQSTVVAIKNMGWTQILTHHHLLGDPGQVTFLLFLSISSPPKNVQSKLLLPQEFSDNSEKSFIRIAWHGAWDLGGASKCDSLPLFQETGDFTDPGSA